MKLILALILSINISFAQSLIGSGANQVPTNGMLGSMAFEDNKNYTKSSSLGTMAFETASLYPKTSTLGTMAFETASLYPKTSALGTMAFENASDYSKSTSINIVTSASSGPYSNSTNTYTDVTNSSINITTSGRPVLLSVTSNSSTSCFVAIGTTGSADATFIFTRGGSTIGSYQFVVQANASPSRVPGSVLNLIDSPSAGTHNYKIRAKVDGGSVSLGYCVLTAREI